MGGRCASLVVLGDPAPLRAVAANLVQAGRKPHIPRDLIQHVSAFFTQQNT